MAVNFREAGPGIFYTAEPIVTADLGVIKFLKQAALACHKRRSRLCAHPSPDATQHDMLIVMARDTYVAPHRHLLKSETLLVVEGSARAVIFDDGGAVRDIIRMGSADSASAFFYRMPERTYHGILIDTDMLVTLESARGPFRPDETESAPWAPPPNDFVAGMRYLDALREKVRKTS